jgi:hypothetical protein
MIESGDQIALVAAADAATRHCARDAVPTLVDCLDERHQGVEERVGAPPRITKVQEWRAGEPGLDSTDGRSERGAQRAWTDITSFGAEIAVNGEVKPLGWVSPRSTLTLTLRRRRS